jgi:hypothetical protein
LGKVLDSIVKEWKEKGLNDQPLYDLIVQAANEYADDPEFDSLVERVLIEALLCTCKSLLDGQLGPLPDDAHVMRINYRGFDPLLHEKQCPLRSGQTLIIDDTVTQFFT